MSGNKASSMTRNSKASFSAYWVSDYSGEVSGPKITEKDVESLKKSGNQPRKSKK